MLAVQLTETDQITTRSRMLLQAVQSHLSARHRATYVENYIRRGGLWLSEVAR